MRNSKRIAGNTATGLLKVIALCLMFVDHAGKMLCGNMLEMRLIGRAAFPLYCWCMVVGFSCTRSVPRYLMRIAAVGLISQPLYMLAMNHTWNEPNVFLTLLLALCALWGIREKKWLSHIWAPVIALCLAQWLGCDYGWQCVMLILLLYAVRSTRPGIAAVMIAFCMYWGSSSASVNQLFGYMLAWPQPLVSLVYPWMKVQTMAIFALPLMLIRFPKDIRMPRYLGYALYPLHLVILYLLEVLM